mgnify:CR=1 FL=1
MTIEKRLMVFNELISVIDEGSPIAKTNESRTIMDPPGFSE